MLTLADGAEHVVMYSDIKQIHVIEPGSGVVNANVTMRDETVLSNVTFRAIMIIGKQYSDPDLHYSHSFQFYNIASVYLCNY